MTKVLQQILQAQEPIFSVGLAQLEKMSGHSNIDIRYQASMIERAHVIMKKLGLDSRDTTAEELYQALNARAKRDRIFPTNSDVAIILAKKVVSFNRNDVLQNIHKPFEERTLVNVRRSIKTELRKRYMAASMLPETATREQFIFAGLQKSIKTKGK